MQFKVISGGQTGVDRGALDAAIAVGFPYGGLIPKGRIAEDGIIPLRYHLTETESSDYSFRTEQNVLHSDATLILSHMPVSGGTEFTVKCCLLHLKEHMVIDLAVADSWNQRKIIEWLKKTTPHTLNIAGPRESKYPGIYEKTKRLLERVFLDLFY